MALFRTRTQTVVAVQFNGFNEDEVRDHLVNFEPLPPIGYWVVVRPGVVSILSPADFASQYEPLL